MRLVTAAIALGCAASVTGCANGLPGLPTVTGPPSVSEILTPAPSSPPKTAAPEPEPVRTVPADPWPVPVARAPGWEPFLITEVRRGDALLGPVRIPVGRVFVDLVCDGEGEISLAVLVDLPDGVDEDVQTVKIILPCHRGGFRERLRRSVPPKGLITSFEEVATLRVDAPADARWALHMETPVDGR